MTVALLLCCGWANAVCSAVLRDWRCEAVLSLFVPGLCELRYCCLLQLSCMVGGTQCIALDARGFFSCVQLACRLLTFPAFCLWWLRDTRRASCWTLATLSHSLVVFVVVNVPAVLEVAQAFVYVCFETHDGHRYGLFSAHLRKGGRHERTSVMPFNVEDCWWIVRCCLCRVAHPSTCLHPLKRVVAVPRRAFLTCLGPSSMRDNTCCTSAAFTSWMTVTSSFYDEVQRGKPA